MAALCAVASKVPANANEEIVFDGLARPGYSLTQEFQNLRTSPVGRSRARGGYLSRAVPTAAARRPARIREN